MRVLVAPQEYKGTLTAPEAAAAIAVGLRTFDPEIAVDLLPLADGGPGTVDALLEAVGGQRMRTPAHDPLMRPLDAEWGLLASGIAVIECAAASGILRLTRSELNPRIASSYGTGELIAAAIEHRVREAVIGLGGSATNDGGVGMAAALGFRFLDEAGGELPPGGAALARLAHIDATAANRGIDRVHFAGATDVTNPLCGPDGASAVYGPQKGADATAVAELDAALAHFAEIVQRDLGRSIESLPRAGAAGGLGGGIFAFLNAELQSGAAVVAGAAGLTERIAAADLVITGEGRFDGQTAFGKTPYFVAARAKEAGKPAICLPGSVAPGFESGAGLFRVIEPASQSGEVPASQSEAASQVAEAARRALAEMGIGGL